MGEAREEFLPRGFLDIFIAALTESEYSSCEFCKIKDKITFKPYRQLIRGRPI